MAHQLTIRKDGFAEIAFAGETPWHGLGQEIDQDSDIETWAINAELPPAECIIEPRTHLQPQIS